MSTNPWKWSAANLINSWLRGERSLFNVKMASWDIKQVLLRSSWKGEVARIKMKKFRAFQFSKAHLEKSAKDWECLQNDFIGSVLGENVDMALPNLLHFFLFSVSTSWASTRSAPMQKLWKAWRSIARCQIMICHFSVIVGIVILAIPKQRI